MFDFVLGIGLAGLAVRGWLRGFVREVLDLVSLVLGIFVAFLLSAPLGDFLSDRFSVGPEAARIGSGILLFVLFGVAMSIAAHLLSNVMRLPGLNLMNRIGGSAVAVAWGVALVLVLVNVGRVLPLPQGVDDAMADSVVIDTIAGDEAIPQRLFVKIGTNGILASLDALQTRFGATRVVPSGLEVVSVPPAPAEELRLVRSEVELVAERINEMRTTSVVGALLLADGLTGLAESRAAAMYQAGRITRETPVGGTVSDDLVAVGIRLEVSGEVLALASTTRSDIDAAFDNAEASGLLLAPSFDRMGIALLEGPTGILLVVVLGG